MSGTSAPTPPSRRSRGARISSYLRSGPAARLLPRLVALNIVEGAVRLAAQAFLAALPLLMTVAAFAPDGVQDLLADALQTVVGVQGDTLQEVRRAFDATGPAGNTVGAVGVLVTLASATAFSRALQAVCRRCWNLPRLPLRAAAWRWPLWLVVWLGYLLLQAPIRSGFGAGPVLGAVLSLLGTTLLWWWSQHLLLSARVGWSELLPGAVLAGTGTVVLSWAARLLMPTAMDRSLEEFGLLGPVFTFLSWLIAVFLVAVSGLALGEAVATSAWYRRALGARHRPRGGRTITRSG
ncbi:YhjD/YihY/BrkB family envelope integrity protein [Streptomyces collinus]|uniref:YhjD/YihY/BrkB family envelope integrity protein n=1 Tax=Streptomyces collinus TaxID=42684 RepID=UPI0036B6DC25